MRHMYAVAISLALLLVTPGLATADTNSWTIGRQQSIDFVVKRALAARGVPYAWAGGNTAGPSRGAGEDVNVVGFDSSGLIQYAFAGAGIKMPRRSSDQFNVGRKILPSQARPGDLIFFGPGGSQSVAMYLGNNQMIEATPPVVTVSQVRTANMMPYLVRVIE